MTEIKRASRTWCRRGDKNSQRSVLSAAVPAGFEPALPRLNQPGVSKTSPKTEEDSRGPHVDQNDGLVPGVHSGNPELEDDVRHQHNHGIRHRWKARRASMQAGSW